jgi:predicted nucleotidyltransferase
LGERIERVVLFGSRARGDAPPDSDYDVAVFLHETDSFWSESWRLSRKSAAGAERSAFRDGHRTFRSR